MFDKGDSEASAIKGYNNRVLQHTGKDGPPSAFPRDWRLFFSGQNKIKKQFERVKTLLRAALLA